MLPITFFLLFLSIILPAPVNAVTVAKTSLPTPTLAAPTDSPLIKKIREAVQQTVKEKLKLVTSAGDPANNKKSLIGTVSLVDSQQITVNYQNNSSTISTDNSTVFIDSKRNKTSLDKLKVGQDILALGYTDDKGDLTAKRVVFVDLKQIENNKIVAIGKIVDISQTSPIFVLIPSRNKDLQYQIKTDDKTVISTGKNIPKLKISDLKMGDKIIAVIEADAKNGKSYIASRIIPLDNQNAPAASNTSDISPTPTPKSKTVKK